VTCPSSALRADFSLVAPVGRCIPIDGESTLRDEPPKTRCAPFRVQDYVPFLRHNTPGVIAPGED
jgi:hypothetical protein